MGLLLALKDVEDGGSKSNICLKGLRRNDNVLGDGDAQGKMKGKPKSNVVGTSVNGNSCVHGDVSSGLQMGKGSRLICKRWDSHPLRYPRQAHLHHLGVYTLLPRSRGAARLIKQKYSTLS